MQQFSLEFEPSRKVYTVNELNAAIRQLLDRHFGSVLVSGEISAVRLAPSGHYYFTLKDGESQIRCACFRSSARYLKFKPQDGIAVVARGRIDVYEARGEYQLLVEHLEPQGHGALQFAFEQLKSKLAAEGLFAVERKRSLPKYPVRIGIVTSPAGAVIQDMLKILNRRFAGLHIRIYPALVQGEGSVEQVSQGIEYFSAGGWAEVVIVARGGGSLEDLWTFNEEAVARAIACSRPPVVSAVGHETDFTIADMVADLRAPTPSAAAELVVCEREQVLENIAGYERRATQGLRYRISVTARRLHENGLDRATALLHRRIGRGLQTLDELNRCAAEALRRDVRDRAAQLAALELRLRQMDLRLRFAAARKRLDTADMATTSAVRRALERDRSRLHALTVQLQHLSPLAVLDRGFAIVQNEAAEIVRSPEQAAAGEILHIRLAQGEIQAERLPSTNRIVDTI
jgi:exodeoxyribonuclease VII large subunit